jgi:hypothetical protein
VGNKGLSRYGPVMTATRRSRTILAMSGRRSVGLRLL